MGDPYWVHSWSLYQENHEKSAFFYRPVTLRRPVFFFKSLKER